MTKSIIPSGFARISGALALAAALESVPSDALAFNIVGDANSHRFSNGAKTVLSFTQSGSLTVSGSGTIELLVVGGGGGGGVLGTPVDQNSGSVAAGGGAGGLVHKATFSVSAGTYAVTVGAGGAVGANGGNSSVFNITGYGGGHGGAGGAAVSGHGNPGGNGGSGGGSTSGWVNTVDGGSAIYGDEDNLGHDGSKGENRFCCGGGGGAGSSPMKKVQRLNGEVSYDTVLDIDNPTNGIAYGGDGLAFDITGSAVYYAGGGAAYTSYGGMRAMGGKGGGGHGNVAGVDGLGGGGGGGAKGGSGCVIMSFIPDEAPQANSSDFVLSGGDAVIVTTNGVALKFTTSGTLTVTGSGTVELLVVGGGGGGGAFTEFSGVNVAPGGGAGGLVYAASVPVTAGSYAITIGAGGAVGANGSNSSALGFVAYGGGAGGQKTWGKNGGSGGGSGNGWENTFHEGWAAYPAWGNQGHDGSRHGSRFYCGGGGGAGGPPALQVQGGTTTVLALDPFDKSNVVGPAYGGDGLAFDITGVSTYYAGGGAAYHSYNTGIALGGKGGGGNGNQTGTDGLGGGGGGGKAGGSGVVIVRYKLKAKAAIPAAEGGTVTRRDGCRIHTFTSDGTFTLPQPVLCDVLVVGGGGGGGTIGTVPSAGATQCAAGGGAGGLIYHKSLPIPAGTYSVTVGAGGAIDCNGDDSSVFGITAYGGGFGAQGGSAPSGQHGRKGSDGGSGGGSSSGWGTVIAGGSAIYRDEGNLGHDGSEGVNRFSCGGGGGAGSSPTKKVQRNSTTILDIDDASDGVPYGGDGLAFDITGESVYYAGGGAAYLSANSLKSPGGKGGGGASKSAGTDGLGGGGGGGARGGSGVVIIRYESNTPTLITFR